MHDVDDPFLRFVSKDANSQRFGWDSRRDVTSSNRRDLTFGTGHKVQSNGVGAERNGEQGVVDVGDSADLYPSHWFLPLVMAPPR